MKQRIIQSMSVIGSIVVFGQMIKFSHSIFALPFALAGAVLAAKGHGIEWQQVAWIVVAMVSARSAAMGFNRLADRKMDAQNPRTRDRALPRGWITPRTVAVTVATCCVLFVFAAYQLNPLCLMLSPVALLVILSYSFLQAIYLGDPPGPGPCPGHRTHGSMDRRNRHLRCCASLAHRGRVDVGGGL